VRNLLAGARRVVVLLLDALGYEALETCRAGGRLPFLERLIEAGHYLRLTTVFPSATNNVLHAFHTGQTPLEHGLPGYRLYIEEAGVVGEMIRFVSFHDRDDRPGEPLADLGLNLDSLVSTTLFERLSAADVFPTVVFQRGLIDSPLSQLNHRGAGRIVPFVDTADQMIQLRRCVAELGSERGFIYSYWDAIDTIQHVHGAAGEETEAELAKVLFSLEREWISRLSPQEARGTVLVILSDHGQVTVTREGYFSIYSCPEILAHLELPLGGNERVSYARAKAGCQDALGSALRAKLPPGFEVLERADVVASGVFGSGSTHLKLPSRVGDFVILAPPGRALDHRVGETRSGGMHGGLTAAEVFIPFLAVDLGELVQ